MLRCINNAHHGSSPSFHSLPSTGRFVRFPFFVCGALRASLSIVIVYCYPILQSRSGSLYLPEYGAEQCLQAHHLLHCGLLGVNRHTSESFCAIAHSTRPATVINQITDRHDPTIGVFARCAIYNPSPARLRFVMHIISP